MSDVGEYPSLFIALLLVNLKWVGRKYSLSLSYFIGGYLLI